MTPNKQIYFVEVYYKTIRSYWWTKHECTTTMGHGEPTTTEIQTLQSPTQDLLETTTFVFSTHTKSLLMLERWNMSTYISDVKIKMKIHTIKNIGITTNNIR
jgi:hypothetical protein